MIYFIVNNSLYYKRKEIIKDIILAIKRKLKLYEHTLLSIYDLNYVCEFDASLRTFYYIDDS